MNYLESFRLFVKACNLCLDDLPAHLHYRLTGESIADPQSKQRWEKEMRGVSDQNISRFAEAFAVLLNTTHAQPLDDGFYFDAVYGPDIIGGVYMEMLTGRSNKWNYNAQYFTPWGVALMMAKMQAHDGQIEEEFYRQLRAVVDDDPLLQALTLASGLCGQLPEDNGGAFQFWLEKCWHQIQPKLTPLRVSDCCVGSGIMLLAFAACHPLWLSQIGFIQYFGQDIDALCVEMCRLNLRLYGIIPVSLAPLTVELLLNKPELFGRHRENLEAAVAAKSQGDVEKAVMIAQEVKQEKLKQGLLFEM